MAQTVLKHLSISVHTLFRLYKALALIIIIPCDTSCQNVIFDHGKILASFCNAEVFICIWEWALFSFLGVKLDFQLICPIVGLWENLCWATLPCDCLCA